FDTADIYGATPGLSESLMGEALQGRRDEVVLATKFGHGAFASPAGFSGSKGSRAYVTRALEASLTRLRTDSIDLHEVYTPDADTSIEEAVDALCNLVHESRVRYIGHANFAGWQVAEAARIADARRSIPF